MIQILKSKTDTGIKKKTDRKTNTYVYTHTCTTHTKANTASINVLFLGTRYKETELAVSCPSVESYTSCLFFFCTATKKKNPKKTLIS